MNLTAGPKPLSQKGLIILLLGVHLPATIATADTWTTATVGQATTSATNTKVGVGLQTTSTAPLQKLSVGVSNDIVKGQGIKSVVNYIS